MIPVDGPTIGVGRRDVLLPLVLGLLRVDVVQKSRKFEVSVCHAADVVAVEPDVDPVVDIRPLRMMVEFVDPGPRRRQEVDRPREVGERERLGQGFTVIRPAGQAFERLSDLVVRQRPHAFDVTPTP